MLLPVGVKRLRALFIPLENLDVRDCMALLAMQCFGVVFCHLLF